MKSTARGGRENIQGLAAVKWRFGALGKPAAISAIDHEVNSTREFARGLEDLRGQGGAVFRQAFGKLSNGGPIGQRQFEGRDARESAEGGVKLDLHESGGLLARPYGISRAASFAGGTTPFFQPRAA